MLAVTMNKILDVVIRVVERNRMTSCPRHFLGEVLLSSYHMGKNYVSRIY